MAGTAGVAEPTPRVEAVDRAGSPTDLPRAGLPPTLPRRSRSAIDSRLCSAASPFGG